MPGDTYLRDTANARRFLSGWSVSLFVLLFLLTSFGCRSTHFLTVRHVPRSPLEGPLQLVSYKGPQPSGRTEQLLRRYALIDAQQEHPQEVLNRLQAELSSNPST